MSLSQGRHYLAIPGPSVMPDAVLRAMHRAAPNIYTGELPDMMPGIVADLKAVARTAGNVAAYIANGHGVWEAALANTLSRGDRVLVLATGAFGLGWAGMAERLGVRAEVLDFGRRGTWDTARIAEALAADPGHGFKAVLAVHVDTATSVRNRIEEVRAALDAAGHPALLMADCIASLACDRFEMDAAGVDVMVAGCQKGLMTPPGMGFVFFNARADRARDSADLASAYWDWRPRVEAAGGFYEYFCGTAPTHHLYGLRAALDMIAEEGLEAVWRRHERLAAAIWAAFEAWGKGGEMELNVPERAQRSCAVTTVRAGSPKGADLRAWLTEKAGVTLGIGLGMDASGRESPSFFRLGHMGHVNAQMVMGALGSIEAGLKAVGIAHGPGGLDAAAEVIAGA